MTDHAARIKEIERQFSAQWYEGESYRTIRYLLDRVRALEAALRMAETHARDEDVFCFDCKGIPYDGGHAADCIVLTLPAPVEAQ